MGWTTEKLKKVHISVPANPLLAEPMYLKGYIERLGTGTVDIVRIARENGLKEPEFEQDDTFKVTIYRPSNNQATGEATGEVKKMILVLDGEMKRADIQSKLGLKHDDYFRTQYIIPALESGLVAMKYPDSPKHPHQMYKLTERGLQFKKSVE